MVPDTHAHLDSDEFHTDLADVLDVAQRAGVDVIICPGITVGSSRRVIQLAEEYPRIMASVGIHPNYAGQAQPADWSIIESLAAHNRVVAIGETGLDRYWNFTSWSVQEEYFDRHLWLAAKMDLPVIVHCRDAEADVYRHLKEATSHSPISGVIHAFGSSPEWAREFLDLGFNISFAGSVTYRNRKFDALRQAVNMVPLDKLLVETDSPYLVPESHRGKLKRNHPGLVTEIVRSISRLRRIEFDILCEILSRNARTLFRKIAH